MNVADNDWENLVPVAAKESKHWVRTSQDRAIFRLVSNGLKTQRDEWVYDYDRENLIKKINLLVEEYESARQKGTEHGSTIKWDADLSRYLARGVIKRFNDKSIILSTYRPFTRRWVYLDKHFNSRVYHLPTMFGNDGENTVISFSDPGFRADFCVLASNCVVDLHFGASVDAYQVVSRYRFNGGARIDNITDWALDQFREHYESAIEERPITKDAIFHYVYGVLHDPAYREKYVLNLKREFPRIPFYEDFWRWAAWGERLMELHIGYESVEPWPLTRLDVPDEKSRAAGLPPRVLLRADKAAGVILLDSETQLGGVPKEAWEYRLGNRSALEWVLDQHKEKTPKDPTIRARFNTYRFTDHKERVIDLLRRVARVSVETMAIVAAMREESDLD